VPTGRDPDFLTGEAYNTALSSATRAVSNRTIYPFVRIVAERSVPNPDQPETNVVQYCVHWQGQYDDTWEFAPSFSNADARAAIDDWRFYKEVYLSGECAGGPGGPPLYTPLSHDVLPVIVDTKIEEISAALSAQLARHNAATVIHGNNVSVVFAIHHIDVFVALFQNFLTAIAVDALALLACRHRGFSKVMSSELFPHWLRVWPSLQRAHARTSRYGCVLSIAQNLGARVSLRRLPLDDCSHSACPRCSWTDASGPRILQPFEHTSTKVNLGDSWQCKLTVKTVTRNPSLVHEEHRDEEVEGEDAWNEAEF